MSYRPIVDEWKKSSFCESSGCVYVAVAEIDSGQVVHVRDDYGPFLTFSLEEWDAFVAGVKAGEFDL